MILPKQKVLPKITPNNNLLENIEEVKHFIYLRVFLTNEVSVRGGVTTSLTVRK